MGHDHVVVALIVADSWTISIDLKLYFESSTLELCWCIHFVSNYILSICTSIHFGTKYYSVVSRTLIDTPIDGRLRTVLAENAINTLSN